MSPPIRLEGKPTHRLVDEKWQKSINFGYGFPNTGHDDEKTAAEGSNLIHDKFLFLRGRLFFCCDGRTYSYYRCISLNWEHDRNVFFEEPNCAILLISEKCFAAGIFRKGILTKQTYHFRQKGAPLKVKIDDEEQLAKRVGVVPRRSRSKKITDDIREVLECTWKEELNSIPMVFFSCPKEYQNIIFPNLEKRGKYRFIPFKTGVPSAEEIRNTYHRLTTVVEHGTYYEFNSLVWNRRKHPKIEILEDEVQEEEEIVPLFVSRHRSERRAEKQRWPGIDADTKDRLHSALIGDNYDIITGVAQSARDKAEVIDYLSAIHPKLNNQSFLHLAVSLNFCETVESLLDLGCDPSIKDDNGVVPYKLCKTEEMKEVFKKFRTENPYNCSWTRSEIPSPECEIFHRNKKEIPKRRTKESIKDRRKHDKAVKSVHVY